VAACSNSTSLQHCKYFLGQWAWLLPIIIVIPLNSGHWTLSSHWTLSWFVNLQSGHPSWYSTSWTYRTNAEWYPAIFHYRKCIIYVQYSSYSYSCGTHYVEKYWKCHKSPTNGPIWTKLEWSQHIMSPTCRPWCGCHGKGRCLATAHWTFCSYGRLKAGSVNQFWWNLVHNSRFGSQWQSHDQILKFFYIQDGRQPPYWKILEML